MNHSLFKLHGECDLKCPLIRKLTFEELADLVTLHQPLEIGEPVWLVLQERRSSKATIRRALIEGTGKTVVVDEIQFFNSPSPQGYYLTKSTGAVGRFGRFYRLNDRGKALEYLGENNVQADT